MYCAASARCFAVKIGVQPDRVLLALMNDRMVAKGVILQFVTEFFKDFLSSEGIDDLVALLGKAKLESRLLEFFPPHKRTAEEFESHFKVIRKAMHEECRIWRDFLVKFRVSR